MWRNRNPVTGQRPGMSASFNDRDGGKIVLSVGE
jgi:hypothetical protein